MPLIHTARLLLRPYAEPDRSRFIGLFTDPVLTRYIGGVMPTAQAEGLFEELSGQRPPRPRIHTAWAACLREEEGDYIAHAVLLNEAEGVEIGFLVATPYQGQGYATELAEALLAYGHEDLGLARLIATVDDDNLASRRVLEKAGMTPAREETDEEGAFWIYEHRSRIG